MDKDKVVKLARKLLEINRAIVDHKCDEYYCLMPMVGAMCPTAVALEEDHKATKAELASELGKE